MTRALFDWPGTVNMDLTVPEWLDKIDSLCKNGLAVEMEVDYIACVDPADSEPDPRWYDFRFSINFLF